MLRSGLAQRDQCAERANRRSKNACQRDGNGRDWRKLLWPQQPKSAKGEEPTAYAAQQCDDDATFDERFAHPSHLGRAAI
ncbi:protein of unknown function [Methylorubrum extorquens]|uniref:Uncharacterized protein n=1 Tax=Methylorubrum extorquens TaxID=408 RepID=A0A2N9AM67_METEX|nr:protein of unknown function [Methylorubrum extorquens]